MYDTVLKKKYTLNTTNSVYTVHILRKHINQNSFIQLLKCYTTVLFVYKYKMCNSGKTSHYKNIDILIS
jgi:hypothetical protein